jgi:hypothetical protein
MAVSNNASHNSWARERDQNNSETRGKRRNKKEIINKNKVRI